MSATISASSSAKLQSICEAAGQHSQAYHRLETLCVEYGHRLAGSSTLHRAANWALELMKADGLDNVHLQPVPTEIWHRGKEWARLVTPREKSLSILGIGASVSTFDANPNVPAGHACSTARARPTCSHADCAVAEQNAAAASGHDGILRASVAVVHEYEEFEAVAATGALKGKIVLFNAPFHSYDHSKDFRAHAASRAARAGAVAVLVRSIAPESLYTPHTGSMRYSVPQHIPAACIAIEDADFLETLVRRRQGTDEQVEIELYMEAHSAGTIVTHNVVGELRGTEKPEEIVLIGAHLDSWDVGQGAHDDGQGCMVAWETLRLCKQLNITTKRTLRCVLFADEEHRQSGARAYQLDNAAVGSDGLTKHVAAIESDVGCWPAIGFGYSGSAAGMTTASTLVGALTPFVRAEQTLVLKGDGRGVDIRPLSDQGVPCFLLRLEDNWWDSAYFKYHHTEADTIDKINPLHLVQNLQCVASLAVALADDDSVLDRHAPGAPFVSAPSDFVIPAHRC